MLALAAALLAAPALAGETPQGFTNIVLPQGALTVHDGDTFDADLDGDGRLSLPRERVRLLFVDTPELGESDKGQDPIHGLPARDFLAGLLAGRPLRLSVPLDAPTGNYGRTLALVQAGDTAVNLALIRAGHSYFDTRFRFPADYPAYAAAEAEAFSARRGIWSDAPSRQRYLARLQREGKTPAAPDNARYLAQPQEAADFRPAGLLGRYVHLRGRVVAVRTLGKGVRRVELARSAGAAPFPAVAFARTAERLAVDSWTPGTPVALEGFIQTYRGALELRIHYGAKR